MLTRIAQPQFVTKILTDQYGRQYRVVFAVSLVNGEVRGRIISASLLTPEAPKLAGRVASAASAIANFFLGGPRSSASADTAYVPAFAPVTFSLSDLEFFLNSQPTRAPSHI